VRPGATSRFQNAAAERPGRGRTVPYTWHDPVSESALNRRKAAGLAGMAFQTAPVVGLVAVYLLIGVIAAGFAAFQSPLLALGGAAFLFASALALWRPRTILPVVLCGGVFAADYLSPPAWPLSVEIDGLRVTLAILLFCGLGALINSGIDRPVRSYVALAALLALGWFMVPLGIDTSGHPGTALSSLLSRSAVEVTAMLSVLAVCGTVKGRVAALRGLAAAGGVAAIAAIGELGLGRNPLLDLASDGSRVQIWLDVTERFGLHRAALGFGHPLLLGVFLGIAMLATLELARRGALAEGWAVALVALQGLGLLATLSRGPLLAAVACLCLWAIGARKMQKWRQAVLIVIVAASIGMAVWSVGFGGNAEEFVRPSATEMGRTSQHRVSLVSAFFSEVRTGAMFGVFDVADTVVAKRFGQTLDNAGLYEYKLRGLSGLMLMTALLLGPAVVMLFRPSVPRQQRLFPVLLGLFLLMAGANVAFFGQLLPYLMAAAAVAWAALGEAPEVTVDGVASGADVADAPAT